jgi:hypothetical protein
MKKVFKEIGQLKHRHLAEIASLSAAAMILIFAAVFVADGGMTKINHLLAINHVTSGSQTAINWGCTFGYSCDNATQVIYYIQANGYANSTPSYPPGSAITLTWAASEVNGGLIAHGCIGGIATCTLNPTPGAFTDPNVSGTFTVYPTVTTTYSFYSTSIGPAYGTPTVTVNISIDNCPAAPTVVSGGFQVPSGTYHIVAQGNDFCITNNSGKYLFVPAHSVTEVNNFKSATQGYLASTVVYFARAAGY